MAIAHIAFVPSTLYCTLTAAATASSFAPSPNRLIQHNGTTQRSRLLVSSAKTSDDHASNIKIPRVVASATIGAAVACATLVLPVVVPDFALWALPPAQAISGGGKDFASKDWSGQDFSGKEYIGKDFSGCIARGTNFTGSDLRGARFFKADLRDADFTEANLSSASMEGASLRDVILKDAVLNSAYFTESILEAGDLQGADFTDALLPETGVIGKLCTRKDIDTANSKTGVVTRDSLMCPIE